MCCRSEHYITFQRQNYRTEDRFVVTGTVITGGQEGGCDGKKYPCGDGDTGVMRCQNYTLFQALSPGLGIVQ